MKKLLVLSLFFFGALAAAQEKGPAKPAAGHDFLKQFSGHWDCDVEMVLEPGKPAIKSKSKMV
ncbi:MAG: DUF1579 domain-containing protein [Gemmataceae bacterium]|nr:DUF1579 domain-containing protein [Gemmataceae bacterium]